MRAKKSLVVFVLIPLSLAIAWAALTLLHIGRFDKPPFILLNLAFSTQAAYAAPLILLAQTRQADRDKVTADQARKQAELDVAHREQLASEHTTMLAANTTLTEQVKAALAAPAKPSPAKRLATKADATPAVKPQAKGAGS